MSKKIVSKAWTVLVVLSALLLTYGAALSLTKSFSTTKVAPEKPAEASSVISSRAEELEGLVSYIDQEGLDNALGKMVEVINLNAPIVVDKYLTVESSSYVPSQRIHITRLSVSHDGEKILAKKGWDRSRSEMFENQLVKTCTSEKDVIFLTEGVTFHQVYYGQKNAKLFYFDINLADCKKLNTQDGEKMEEKKEVNSA